MLSNKVTNGVLIATIATAVLTVIFVLIFMLGPNYPIQGADVSVIEVKVEEGYKVLYHSNKDEIKDNALKVEGAGTVILVR